MVRIILEIDILNYLSKLFDEDAVFGLYFWSFINKNIWVQEVIQYNTNITSWLWKSNNFIMFELRGSDSNIFINNQLFAAHSPNHQNKQQHRQLLETCWNHREEPKSEEHCLKKNLLLLPWAWKLIILHEVLHAAYLHLQVFTFSDSRIECKTT